MNNKKYFALALIFIASILVAQTSLPKVVSGRIIRLENFSSKYVSPRNVDIWLPEGYSDTSKYAVLYMHDGQMLFDPEQTWNKQAWKIDEVATRLMGENKIKKFIVVGIWNDKQTRHRDYFPKKPFDELLQKEKDTVSEQLRRAGRTIDYFEPKSDRYLKFIVKELKPFIDKHYAVHTNRENTCIAGSSMGGLISMYALCEYPRIFGGAACLSTHWTGTFSLANNPMPDKFLKYLNKHLPKPKTHKIYFDCGDQTLDAMYPEIQKKVDSLLIKKGFNKNLWMTNYFPGADHSEKSWNARLHIPLTFLFTKQVAE
jgi:enterochelin esterase-like enzyme